MTLELTVTDTGVGIAPADQERLFQPFSQVDATTTRRHGGTGLGLVISERLARLMGGGITMTSEPGHGTCMTVVVSLGVQPDPREPGRPLHGLRLLVLAPGPHATGALASALAALGADARAAATPAELRELAHGGGFSAAVVDAAHAGELPAGLPLVVIGGSDPDLQLPVRTERLAERLLEAIEGAPAVAAPRAPAAPSAAPAAPARARVLVAEDSEVNRMLLTRQLERLGVAADVVRNGREAIAAAERRDYPLILMDLRMPEVDGFDATREIRAAEDGRRVPIVAVTGNASQADRETCLAAGMDDHLAKPVTMDSLREVIDRWLPAAASDTAGDPVDPAAPMLAALDQLAEELGGRDALEPLIRIWEAELPERLAAMELAAGRGSAGELRSLGHTLRGATSMFGDTDVAGACAELEHATTGELGIPEANALVAAIAQAAAVTRATLHAWLARD